MGHEPIIRIILLGPAKSGKTQLMKRYLREIITHEYKTTIGLEFKNKTVTFKGKNYELNYELQLWDTEGSEEKFSPDTNYYYGSKAIIICYDSTKPLDLDSIKKCILEFNQQIAKINKWFHVNTHPDEANECLAVNNDPAIILVATKCDGIDVEKLSDEQFGKLNLTQLDNNLEIEKFDLHLINEQQLNELKLSVLNENQKIFHFSTSALSGKNLDKVFNQIILLQLQKIFVETIQPIETTPSVSTNSSIKTLFPFLSNEPSTTKIKYEKDNIFCEMYKRFIDRKTLQGPREKQLKEFGNIYSKLCELEESMEENILTQLFKQKNSWQVEKAHDNPINLYSNFVKTLRESQENEKDILIEFTKFKIWKEKLESSEYFQKLGDSEKKRHQEILNALNTPQNIIEKKFDWFGF